MGFWVPAHGVLGNRRSPFDHFLSVCGIELTLDTEVLEKNEKIQWTEEDEGKSSCFRRKTRLCLTEEL